MEPEAVIWASELPESPLPFDGNFQPTELAPVLGLVCTGLCIGDDDPCSAEGPGCCCFNLAANLSSEPGLVSL